MSIERLRYFAAVVETKNLRKASEVVRISPPSMSKAINVLEEELGFKLTHPEGRGIGITQKGIEVYQSSISLLEEYKRFFSSMKKKGSSSKHRRLATFEVFSSYFLSSFMASETSCNFLLLEMTPGKIENSILNGTVELGITYIPSLDNQLDYVEVGSFKMGIYGQKKWQKEPFSKWPFAIPITELNIHSSEIDSLDMWPSKAPKRKNEFHFELLETALQTTRLGISVIHCPDFIVKIHNEQVKKGLNLVELERPKGYTKQKIVKVYLVAKKGSIPKTIEGKLAKFMRMLKQ